MTVRPYILVVDDEPLNQMVIQSFLSHNYDVTTASNGMECINSLSERIPDLIITDIEMPVMNGLDMCQLIKQNTDYKHIPVIFMSTISSNEIENRCKEVGGAYFFKKPLDKEELLSKVKELIEISI